MIIGLGHVGIIYDGLMKMRNCYIRVLSLIFTGKDQGRRSCFRSAAPKPEHHALRSGSSISEAAQNARDKNAVVGVVFDGDDTLWCTEQLYDDARWYARRIVADAGLDGAKWEELERRIDVANVAILGYSMERFPASCVLAYEETCRGERRTPDTSVADRIRHAARSVFERNPPLVSGARETLTCLRARGTRLALLTKGDFELQSRRIAHSGLRDLLHVVEIVPEKSPTTIRSVVASLGVNPESAWMVGNSIRSDVLPAIAAGLHSVWINAHVWEYEREYDHLVDERVIMISRLVEILDLVAV